MENLALILFTLLMQASAGTLIFIAVAKIFNKEASYKYSYLCVAVATVAGCLLSLMHLAVPMSALTSLNNIGTSMLSTEIFLAGSLTVISVIAVIFVFMKKDMIATVLTWLGAIVGIALVYIMSQVYNATSIAIWQGSYVAVDFLTTAVILGAAFFFITKGKEEGICPSCLGIVALAAIAIQVAVAVPYYLELSALGAGASASIEILLANSTAIIAKWLLAIIGLALFIAPAKEKAAALPYIGAVAVICGLAIGRYLFFASMVVSQVGLV